MITVAEERSFSKAAKKLYIAQPSLSQSIGSMEEEYGVKLFDRSTTPLTLTYAGELFLESAKSMLDIEKELRMKMYDITGNRRGRIAIGMSVIWGMQLIPAIFPAFRHEYQNVELKLVENSREKLTQLLLDGSLDMIVSNQYQTEHNLKYIKVYEDEVLLAVPSSHKLASKFLHNERLPEIDLYDFRDEPFILSNPGQGLRKSADEVFDQYGIRPNIILETQNVETALSLVSKGMGCTFILESVIKLIKPNDPISCMRLNRGIFKHSMNICYRENMYLSKPMLRLIELIQEGFSDSDFKERQRLD